MKCTALPSSPPHSCPQPSLVAYGDAGPFITKNQLPCHFLGSASLSGLSAPNTGHAFLRARSSLCLVQQVAAHHKHTPRSFQSSSDSRSKPLPLLITGVFMRAGMEALPVPWLQEYTQLWDMALSGFLQRGWGHSGLHLFPHKDPWATHICHTGPACVSRLNIFYWDTCSPLSGVRLSEGTSRNRISSRISC